MINLIYIYSFVLLIFISAIDFKTKEIYIVMPIAGIIPLLLVSLLPSIIFACIIFVTFFIINLFTVKLGRGDNYVFVLSALMLNSPNQAFVMIFVTFTIALIYSLVLKRKGINRFNALCPFILIATMLVKFVVVIQ
ncbi:hypothetical protein [Clostridium estertheticum]|uniref:hypothetical protein n=1 Tax=Clostridium estertheticum TaxID=238834 RepID=UPI001C0E1AEF|nr:hypothetical protein [Clostridium estertheticum]MBU3173299.1 hypothetical protein [Clostridium estertheticum]